MEVVAAQGSVALLAAAWHGRPTAVAIGLEHLRAEVVMDGHYSGRQNYPGET